MKFSRRKLLAGGGALAGAVAVNGIGRTSGLSLPSVTGSARGPMARKSGGLFRYAEAGAFATFNPWHEQPVEEDIANQIYSRLVYVDARGKPVPDLAQSWTLAPNARQLTLKLRPNLTWHSGKKVSASDFVRMYGYMSNPALKTDLGVEKMTALFKPVSSVRAEKADTIVMQFSDPVPYVWDILSYWYLVNLDNTSDPNFMSHLPDGTGPYQMVRFDPSQGAYLKAFPNYYAGKPAVSQLQFNTFAAGTSLVSDLQSGLVDGVLVTNYADMKSISHNKSYTHSRVQTGVWDLMVNSAKAPFTSQSVRQALSYSLDRAQISQAAYFGYEKPVSTPFFAPAATGYVKSLVNAQSFDLNTAKSLLDGANVGSLSMNFPLPVAYPPLQTLAEIWQADLARIGVTLNIQPVDTPSWLSYITNPATDVLIWNNGRCLLDGAVFWATQGNFVPGNSQSMGYRDSFVSSLIAQGQAQVNPLLRAQTYQDLNHSVVDSAHCIAIVTYSNTWAWSAKVRGESADLIGNLQLGSASLT
ncbi:MAG: ABC transporter substrate-binding protein [Actinomycetota bacterium]|nr:ABC transporter substrate-binding protein [Actinomycetota bacterium]